MGTFIPWTKPKLPLGKIELLFGKTVKDTVEMVADTEFGGQDREHEFIIDGMPFIYDPGEN